MVLDMDNRNFCTFCKKNTGLIIEKTYVKAFFDKFPVSKGHTIIVPRRHVETVFELKNHEIEEIAELIIEIRTFLDELYTPEGYNIGTNCGEVAGQTIPHCHINIIPRFKGDVSDTAGGIRGVIPNKKNLF